MSQKTPDLLRKFVSNFIEDNFHHQPDEPKLFRHKHQLIFVYGTLKKDYPYHSIISNRKYMYLGSGLTSKDYILFDYTFRNEKKEEIRYPVAIEHLIEFQANFDEVLKALPIRGEIYLVETPTLLNIDEVEQCNELYYRIETPVCITNPQFGDIPETIYPWMYFGYPENWDSDALMGLMRPSYAFKNEQYIFTKTRILK